MDKVKDAARESLQELSQMEEKVGYSKFTKLVTDSLGSLCEGFKIERCAVLVSQSVFRGEADAKLVGYLTPDLVSYLQVP